MEGITIFFCPFKVAGTWKSRVQRELASLYFLKPSNHPTILPNFFQILVIHSSRSRSLLPLTNFPPRDRNESTKVSLEILSPLLIPNSLLSRSPSPIHKFPIREGPPRFVLPRRVISFNRRNSCRSTFTVGRDTRKQIKQGEISSFLVTTISIYSYVSSEHVRETLSPKV